MARHLVSIRELAELACYSTGVLFTPGRAS